jgi:hypothetical protein
MNDLNSSRKPAAVRRAGGLLALLLLAGRLARATGESKARNPKKMFLGSNLLFVAVLWLTGLCTVTAQPFPAQFSQAIA